MNENFLELVESPSKNEKKRFFELFDSYNIFFYQHLQESLFPKDEKLYFETARLVDNLQKIKDSQKISPRVKAESIYATGKKPLIEPNEIKFTPFIHHGKTNSLGGQEKKPNNLTKTPQKKLIVTKEFDKFLTIKNFNNNIKTVQDKCSTSHQVRNPSVHAENSQNGHYKMFSLLFTNSK